MQVVHNSFADFGLKSSIMNALKDLGYHTPSCIQLECIPYLLAGRDVLGIAQTGSGKTAAFLLPLLHNINIKIIKTQILILTPTRELAMQISEVCLTLSKYIKSINIATLYGGQCYEIQFRALNRGAHIIVGTPGRLLDHLCRGTLDLSGISGLVLDEADKMLRMGFIEDVRKILLKIPTKHQTALFSATLPEAIRHIMYNFMINPKEIYINSGLTACSTVTQYYCLVNKVSKIEILMRFLEVENFDAVIVFVRTKNAAVEISGILEYFGYNCAALNGDMNQNIRKDTLDRFKNGKLDILIATDIASRGLDVTRISLVINYDIPLDVESYVHRIGRTGRAGRFGRSLLFIENHEFYLLRNIERNINLTISKIQFPTCKVLIARRLERFSMKIRDQLKSKDLNMYYSLLTQIQSSMSLSIETLGATLLKIAQGERPLIISENSVNKLYLYNHFSINKSNSFVYFKKDMLAHSHIKRKKYKMSIYRINIGRDHGIKIRNIVNVLADKGGINIKLIGNIQLFASYFTIELSADISNKVLFCCNELNIIHKPIKIQFIGHIFSNYRIHK